MDHLARWGQPPEPHETLPPCSMVLTSGGLLAAKIASLDGMLYALVAYVADIGAPATGAHGRDSSARTGCAP
ncbi:hypothetical protein [Actinomadura keratinilytica]|uniref:Uncharacterized protein n=1 Tax=Actinomadura keratinilytica TaxID=547461 RepID=A0ABP6UKE4_9ACTN